MITLVTGFCKFIFQLFFVLFKRTVLGLVLVFAGIATCSYAWQNTSNNTLLLFGTGMVAAGVALLWLTRRLARRRITRVQNMTRRAAAGKRR